MKQGYKDKRTKKHQLGNWADSGENKLEERSGKTKPNNSKKGKRRKKRGRRDMKRAS